MDNEHDEYERLVVQPLREEMAALARLWLPERVELPRPGDRSPGQPGPEVYRPSYLEESWLSH